MRQGIMALGSWAIAGMALIGNAAEAASFDCGKARTRVEKTLCADPTLSALDEHLGQYFAAARFALGDGFACLRKDQRRWLQRDRNGCSGDVACLQRVYLRRLATLDALQPGATAVRSIDLPTVPVLVWIIPPTHDDVAAAPRPPGRSLLATGRLLDRVGAGDGFVLRTASGTAYRLARAGSVDPASARELALLAQSAKARYRVRGFATADGKGFAPGRCVFLYRQP